VRERWAVVRQPLRFGQPGPQDRSPQQAAGDDPPVPGLPSAAAVLGVLVAVLALTLRLFHLNYGVDIYIDETEYANIAQSVARTGHIDLFGAPFFLHPPLFFLLAGAYLKLLGPLRDPLSTVFAIRVIVVVLGALSAFVIFQIVHIVAGKGAALVASAIFLLDPYAIYLNSENMLQTPALFWLLVGYWTLLGAPIAGAVLAPGRRRTLATGICFGLGLLTEDTTFFLSMLPLLLLLVTGLSLSRRTAIALLGIAVLTYIPYPLIAALVGQWPHFMHAKLAGMQRVAGILQVTGFHHKGAPSFLSSLLARLDLFGTTYLISLTGGLALLLVLSFGRERARVLVAWAAGAYAYLGYDVLHGTLETQFFYYLVVPALMLTACAGPIMLRTRLGHRYRRASLGAGLLTLVALLCWDGVTWTHIHLRAGNAYQQALHYIDTRIPQAERHVAATSLTGQFLLQHPAGPWGAWDTVAALALYRPAYLLVATHQFAFDHPQHVATLDAWLQRHARALVTINSNGTGTDAPLVLYRLLWSEDMVRPGQARDGGAATATAPPLPLLGTLLALDTFARPHQVGWGTPPLGAPWSGTAATAPFAIAHHTGLVQHAQGTYTALLGPTQTNAEVLLTGTLSAFPATTGLGAVLRSRQPGTGDLAWLTGRQVQLVQERQGHRQVLAQVPFVARAGVAYTLRFAAEGKWLGAKVWPAGQGEPAAWTVMGRDARVQGGRAGLVVRLRAGGRAVFSSFLAASLRAAHPR
jgi:4-amino-4-deoxy-L-arabinose transferase-like glycosyltransferase